MHRESRPCPSLSLMARFRGIVQTITVQIGTGQIQTLVLV